MLTDRSLQHGLPASGYHASAAAAAASSSSSLTHSASSQEMQLLEQWYMAATLTTPVYSLQSLWVPASQPYSKDSKSFSSDSLDRRYCRRSLRAPDRHLKTGCRPEGKGPFATLAHMQATMHETLRIIALSRSCPHDSCPQWLALQSSRKVPGCRCCTSAS